METSVMLDMGGKQLECLQNMNKSLEQNNPDNKSPDLGFDECPQEVNNKFFHSSCPLSSASKNKPPESPPSSLSNVVTTVTYSSNIQTCSTFTVDINKNSSCYNTRTSRNVSVSMADSVLSKCLLSSLPTTSSKISTSGLDVNNFTTKTKSSQSKDNLDVALNTENMSTSMDVQRTPHDAFIENTDKDNSIQMIREHALEIINRSNRIGTSKERSPSPSQIASKSILRKLQPSKAHLKVVKSHNRPRISAVRRDLLNAFQKANRPDTNTAHYLNEANNNNHDIQETDKTTNLKELKTNLIETIPCRQRLKRAVCNTEETHVKSNINIMETSHDLYNNYAGFMGTSRDKSLHNSHIPMEGQCDTDVCQPLVQYNGSKSMLRIDNANEPRVQESGTFGPLLENFRNNPIEHDDEKMSIQPSRNSDRSSSSCAIQIRIQSGENINNISAVNSVHAISAKTKGKQNKEELMLTDNHGNVSSSVPISPDDAHCPVKVDRIAVPCIDTGTESIHPADIQGSQPYWPGIQPGTESTLFQHDTSDIPSTFTYGLTKIDNYSKVRNESGYFEDEDEDTHVVSNYQHPPSLQIPLSLHIEDGGSWCGSDDECHESGHATSDDIRNFIDAKGWVWDYDYDYYSDDSEEDLASGPTLSKRIRSSEDVRESNTKDKRVELNSRRNSFSRRCIAFRSREGSLSQRKNVSRSKRNLFEPPAFDTNLLFNSLQKHSSNKAFSNECLTGNVDANTFRTRAVTFSHKPSRPFEVSRPTWKGRGKQYGGITAIPNYDNKRSAYVKDMNENSSQSNVCVGYDNLNTREFLTARRRCSTVSAKDLLAKKPVLSGRFMESNTSIDTIPEDGTTCTLSHNDVNNNTRDHARSIRKVDGEGRFRKRCATFSSSRPSSRALDLTRPVPSVVRHIPPIICISKAKESDTIGDYDKDELAVDGNGSNEKDGDGIALVETEKTQNPTSQSNSLIRHDPELIPRPLLPQSPSNPDPRSTDSGLSTFNEGSSSYTINNVSLKITTTKETSNNNELKDSIEPNESVTSSHHIPAEHRSISEFLHQGFKAPYTDQRRNSVQNVIEVRLAKEFSRMCDNNNVTDSAQCSSTPKAGSNEGEFDRPRSLSVSSGMSSLSLGDPNKPSNL